MLDDTKENCDWDFVQEARYGDLVFELWGHGKIVYSYVDADYQGEVELFVHVDNKYVYYKYWYGSCSGCDEWEDRELDREQIKEIMLKESVSFDNAIQVLLFFKNIDDCVKRRTIEDYIIKKWNQKDEEFKELKDF